MYSFTGDFTHGTQGPNDKLTQHVSGWRIGDALSKSTMLFPRHNRMIDGVMVSVLSSIAADHGFKPRWGQKYKGQLLIKSTH